MVQHKRESGFTLLSQGVALGIISVLLSFTLPQAVATYDIYELGALQSDLEAWANIAQESGFVMARFVPCEEGEPCLYEKWGLLDDCPDKSNDDATNENDDYHDFSGGSCIYNLNNGNHRGHIEEHYTLPGLGWVNRHNGQPIYLLHGDKRAEAFTCVDENLADTDSSACAGTCSASDQKVLCHTLGDIPLEFRKILFQRINLERSANDEDEECSNSGSGSHCR